MQRAHIQELEELIASGRIGTSKIEAIRTLLLENAEQAEEIQRLKLRLEWMQADNPPTAHER